MSKIRYVAKQEEVDEVLHAMITSNAYDKLIELVTIISSGRWEKLSSDSQDALLDEYYENLNR